MPNFISRLRGSKAETTAPHADADKQAEAFRAASIATGSGGRQSPAPSYKTTATATPAYTANGAPKTAFKDRLAAVTKERLAAEQRRIKAEQDAADRNRQSKIRDFVNNVNNHDKGFWSKYPVSDYISGMPSAEQKQLVKTYLGNDYLKARTSSDDRRSATWSSVAADIARLRSGKEGIFIQPHEDGRSATRERVAVDIARLRSGKGTVSIQLPAERRRSFTAEVSKTILRNAQLLAGDYSIDLISKLVSPAELAGSDTSGGVFHDDLPKRVQDAIVKAVERENNPKTRAAAEKLMQSL